jgi:hypothetical protein
MKAVRTAAAEAIKKTKRNNHCGERKQGAQEIEK